MAGPVNIEWSKKLQQNTEIIQPSSMAKNKESTEIIQLSSMAENKESTERELKCALQDITNTREVTKTRYENKVKKLHKKIYSLQNDIDVAERSI